MTLIGNCALVLGANGQDGGYLVQHLLRRGYKVVGIGKQQEFCWSVGVPTFRYISLDLCDTGSLINLLADEKPDVIFHVAAVHGPANFIYEDVWQKTLLVNMIAVQAILEYMRRFSPAARFVYASSSKVFGSHIPRRVNERLRRYSTCLYSISKNTSHDLISYYREHHRLAVSVMYLFNHESVRRPSSFFLPKVVGLLAQALVNANAKGEVATLDFYCDWGDAEEFMDIAVDLSERAIGADMIIASGHTWYARDFVTELFARYGMDYRRHIEERTKTASPPAHYFRVNIGEMKRLLGRTPQRTIFGVCEDILLQNHPKTGASLARARTGKSAP